MTAERAGALLSEWLGTAVQVEDVVGDQAAGAWIVTARVGRRRRRYALLRAASGLWRVTSYQGEA